MPWTMQIGRRLSLALLAFPATLFATEPPPIFDVHLHAIPPAAFIQANEAAFGAFRKTAGGFVADPALLLARTIEEMDKNNIRAGLVSGNNELVQEWAQRYPQRFLPSFSPDLTLKNHKEAAARFASEVAAGRWRARVSLASLMRARH